MNTDRRSFLYISLFVLCTACSQFGVSQRASSISLEGQEISCASTEFLKIATLIIPAEREFEGTIFGGISGIDYDPASKLWYFISDDKGKYGPSRVYVGRVPFHQGKPLEVQLMDVLPLLAQPGERLNASNDRVADAEAVRVASGSHILWSDEGLAKFNTVPSVNVLSLLTREHHRLPLPDILKRSNDGMSGPRENRSFEGLEFEDDGSFWLALEAPLLEQGEPPSLQFGATTSLFRIGADGAVLNKVDYFLEAIPAKLPGLLADNGLSEILKLSSAEMLVLERAGRQNESFGFDFSAKAYCLELNGPNAGEKSLAVTLTDAAPSSAGNFEGMTLVQDPKLQNPVLVFVADNNFAQGVPTYLVFYEVRRETNTAARPLR